MNPNDTGGNDRVDSEGWVEVRQRPAAQHAAKRLDCREWIEQRKQGQGLAWGIDVGMMPEAFALVWVRVCWT
ncbi:MAG: hypothetical protein ACK493_04275 [Planctomycetota bacterium]